MLLARFLVHSSLLVIKLLGSQKVIHEYSTAQDGWPPQTTVLLKSQLYKEQPGGMMHRERYGERKQNFMPSPSTPLSPNLHVFINLEAF